MFRGAIFIGALTVVPAVASAQPCTSDARQVVDRVYQQVLERSPDQGSQVWVDRLSSGDMTVRELMRQVAQSQEHQQRWGQNQTPEQRVRSLYKHLLNRQPDGQAERTMADLLSRQGEQAVVDRIVNSQEYQRSFNDWVVPGSNVRYCANNSQQSRSNVGRYRLPDDENTNGNGYGRNMRFRRMDSNNDGVIQRNEWRGNARTFEYLDTNNDNVLSGDEVAVARGRNDDEREDAINANERFDYLDVNGNGSIDRNEWDGGNNAFDRLDDNRDGRLSRNEFDTMGRSSDFNSLDANRDGRIALNEWPWTHRSFDQQDTNRDGAITQIGRAHV